MNGGVIDHIANRSTRSVSIPSVRLCLCLCLCLCVSVSLSLSLCIDDSDNPPKKIPRRTFPPFARIYDPLATKYFVCVTCNGPSRERERGTDSIATRNSWHPWLRTSRTPIGRGFERCTNETQYIFTAVPAHRWRYPRSSESCIILRRRNTASTGNPSSEETHTPTHTHTHPHTRAQRSREQFSSSVLVLYR